MADTIHKTVGSLTGHELVRLAKFNAKCWSWRRFGASNPDNSGTWDIEKKMRIMVYLVGRLIGWGSKESRQLNEL